MKKFWPVLKSWGNVFFAAIVSALLAILISTGDLPMDADTWKGIVVAGLVSVLPVIRNWLDPKDTRYGKGSE
jgi:hypothetical protein